MYPVARPGIEDQLKIILSEAATYPREDILYAAARSLAELAGRTHSVNALSNVIRDDPNAVKRAVAVRALGYLSNSKDERFSALSQALMDPDVEVRDAAVAALVRLNDHRVIESLTVALKQEKSQLMCETIQDALAELQE